METSDTARPPSTVEHVIQEVLDELRNDEKTDVDLLEILVKHILVESPANTAVANALEQIETLATERVEDN